MVHLQEKVESFKSLIQDFVNNETYWDTRVVCKDGVVRHNQITLGLLFQSLKTSDVFNFPIESTLILPDFSTCDIEDMIEKKLAAITGETQTEVKHIVNIEEIVSAEFNIKEEEDTIEDISELDLPEISLSKNELFTMDSDDYDFDIEAAEVKQKSLYDEIKKTSTKLTIDGKERWNCSMCGQNVAHLDRHVARIHAEKNFKCSECSFATGSLALLKSHESIHNITSESCPICGKTVRFLKMHMKQVHEKTGDHRHFCSECDKSYLREDELTDHINSCHLGLKGTCPICGKELAPKKIPKHIKAVHEKVKNHFCPECGKGFYDKRDMEKHLDRVHKGKKTLCNECGKEFANISGHVKKCHSGLDLRVVCPECGKKVIWLVEHVDSVHKKIKNHQCPECPLKCYEKKTLDAHLKWHKKGSPKRTRGLKGHKKSNKSSNVQITNSSENVDITATKVHDLTTYLH